MRGVPRRVCVREAGTSVVVGPLNSGHPQAGNPAMRPAPLGFDSSVREHEDFMTMGPSIGRRPSK